MGDDFIDAPAMAIAGFAAAPADAQSLAKKSANL